jgi:hypothetical protein
MKKFIYWTYAVVFLVPVIALDWVSNIALSVADVLSEIEDGLRGWANINNGECE